MSFCCCCLSAYGRPLTCVLTTSRVLSKFKLPNQQNGQVYLTSHRICYVDKQEPRKHSVGLDLKDVERHEFYVCTLATSAVLAPRSDQTASNNRLASSNRPQR